jgi:predicted nuclease of restriction endonuclease-like (RecB) superfamily
MDAAYKQWIAELKEKVRSAQLKAAVSVNAELIVLYWDLGKMITEKQTAWGSKFLFKLSSDLRREFPEMQGFSETNLKYCKLFYAYFAIRPQAGDELKNSPQPEDQIPIEALRNIPWGHIKAIISGEKDLAKAQFYISQTIQNGWSRSVLELQLKSNLYERTGKAVTNFNQTLPSPDSDLARQTLKDPYAFDFISIAQPYREKDIENQLVQHITRFLLELGKGFAFVGQQYHLEIAGNDYYIDLLFYHTRLKCYVVIELKNTRFIPEYAGKLNFYLSAVDSLLKGEGDKPTIGIILCREKNNIEAEFSLRDLNKPIGISEFNLTEIVPDELKSSLPTIEEIEQEFKAGE